MFPNVEAANRGIGGERFEDMLTRVDDVLALQPRAVFLMGGINDARDGDLDTSMIAFETIVETFINEGIDIYV